MPSHQLERPSCVLPIPEPSAAVEYVEVDA
jgi:hypothetical protein